jgi:superfamily II DNA/RNA helicase
MKLSKKYLYNPERVAVETDNILLTNIKHDILNIDHNKKYKELLLQLSKRNGSVLIFAKTKHGTKRMAKNLSNDGFKADALNGNLNQNKRDKVMKNFRLKKFKVLVATDIASRGLDVDHIEHVVNYDLPQVAEDYIHRIGRTGRAGSKGSTICFVSPEEQPLWDQIDYLLNPGSANKPKTIGKNSRSARKKSNGHKLESKPSRSFSKSSGPRRSAKGKSLSKFSKHRGARNSSEDSIEKRNSRRNSAVNGDSRPSNKGRPRRNTKGNSSFKSSRNRNNTSRTKGKTLGLRQRSKR